MTDPPTAIGDPTAPSERVRRLIVDALPGILDEAGTDGLVALALVGSASRGEETWSDGALVSDLDVIAVTRTAFAPKLAQRLSRAAERSGRDLSIGCSPIYSLDRYRTLEFYGAKRNGWVFWGAPDVFAKVRMDDPQDIPGWEAIRLVLNRAMDLMRADAGLLAPWYAVVKFYLALGEAELILGGAYDPSYRRQQAQIASSETVLGDRQLRDLVLDAAAVKLDGADPHMFSRGIAEHRGFLIRGMTALLSKYLARDLDVFEALGVLSAGHHSLPHRLYYMARHGTSPRHWTRAIGQDPAFWFWRMAVEALAGKPGPPRAGLLMLIDDFDRTHQPLPR